MPKPVKFQFNLIILFEYLGYTNSQIPVNMAFVIAETIGIVPAEHILSAANNCHNLATFMTRLRNNFNHKHLSAREGVIMYNLLIIQNDFDGTFKEKIRADFENEVWVCRYPTIFTEDRRPKERVLAFPDPRVVVAARKAERQKEYRTRRENVQWEQVSVVPAGGRTDNPVGVNIAD